jgi:hypothetical protein
MLRDAGRDPGLGNLEKQRPHASEQEDRSTEHIPTDRPRSKRQGHIIHVPKVGRRQANPSLESIWRA